MTYNFQFFVLAVLGLMAIGMAGALLGQPEAGAAVLLFAGASATGAAIAAAIRS